MSRLEEIRTKDAFTLDDYAANASLDAAVRELRAEAAVSVPVLEGRKVWMVNSTPKGGGVAEMMPKLVGLLSELGVDVKWLVMRTERPAFFELTKRIHNLLHGHGDPNLTDADALLYEQVSRELADDLAKRVRPEDVLVIHDPQPLGLGALVEDRVNPLSIWRCHIGLDRATPATRAAWEFLRPWARRYDHSVFSATEYIPHYLAGYASVIRPAIDPLSHKNRELSAVKMTGILCNAGLVPEHAPVLTPPWPEQAERVRADGTFGSALDNGEIGLLFRPCVVQISRWDRLKGWRPLLDAFVLLKTRLANGTLRLSDRDRRRLEIARLILAGPDPTAVQDDPEAVEVLAELTRVYQALPPELQADVAVLSLPMKSSKANALMVNVLQRAASVVAQNSIQEGFGLSVTEAMWKRAAVVGSSACGIREQIRDRVDGRIVDDPTRAECVAEVLLEALSSPLERITYGRNAQRKVHSEFLVFRQVQRWLELMASLISGTRPRSG